MIGPHMQRSNNFAMLLQMFVELLSMSNGFVDHEHSAAVGDLMCNSSAFAKGSRHLQPT